MGRLLSSCRKDQRARLNLGSFACCKIIFAMSSHMSKSELLLQAAGVGYSPDKYLEGSFADSGLNRFQLIWLILITAFML